MESHSQFQVANAQSHQTQQQQHVLKAKQGLCPVGSQRRTTSGGGHSSRRSQQGCPIGLEPAVTSACAAPPATTRGDAAEVAAAAAAFAHNAPEQARNRLASLVMHRQAQQQQQQQHDGAQQLQPLRQLLSVPGAPPSTPATATAAAAHAHFNMLLPGAASQQGGAEAAAAADSATNAAAAAASNVDMEEPSFEDFEGLFEEAEGVVDAFMRHPSDPHAAQLFGSDVTDALARLCSSTSPSPPHQSPSKPSFLHSLGFGALGLGFNRQQKQGSGPKGPPATPAAAAGAAAAAAAAAGDFGTAACGLSGTKRSKPSFSLSRDPAADRPHSRREVDPNSDCSNLGLSWGFNFCSAQAAEGAPAGAAEGAAATAGVHTAAGGHAAAGPVATQESALLGSLVLTAAPTPPPTATAADAAAAQAAEAGFGRRRWGLDLSDSGMAVSRPSPFATAERQSAAAAAETCCKDTCCKHTQVAHDPHQPGSSSSMRQPRASLQGLAVVKAGLKASLAHKGSAARRCSCPGLYLEGLKLHSGEASLGGTASGLKVLDLSSPRAQQRAGLLNDVSKSPFASPGTASSSALSAAAVAAAAAAAGVGGSVYITGLQQGMFAAGPFNGAGGFQGLQMQAAGVAGAATVDAAAGAAAATSADGQGSSMDVACSDSTANRGGSSSLQSKRSVGSASTVKKAAKNPAVAASGTASASARAAAAVTAAAAGDTVQQEAAAAAAQCTGSAATAAADSPPAVYVTITSASGMGPRQQSLTRKVSSRSTGSPLSGEQQGAAAAGDEDMTVASESLEAACAAAMAAIAAESAFAAGSSLQQQQQQQQEGDLPRLRPIRTKSRAEGPAAVLNPSATGTAALEAALNFSRAASTATARSGSSGLSSVIAQQQMLLLQHHQQQMQLLQQQQQGADASAAAAGAAGMNAGAAPHMHPPTPAVTPSTSFAGQAHNKSATSVLLMQAATAAAEAARAAAAAEAAKAAPAAAAVTSNAARMSLTGTPSGIANSIAQMTLQSPLKSHLAAAAAGGGANSSKPRNSSNLGVAATAATAAAHDGSPSQQQQQQLPWQHLPASACNGVAVIPGDSGLVLITGQTVTTGLIKTAGTPPAGAHNGSSMNDSYRAAAGFEGCWQRSSVSNLAAGGQQFAGHFAGQGMTGGFLQHGTAAQHNMQYRLGAGTGGTMAGGGFQSQVGGCAGNATMSGAAAAAQPAAVAAMIGHSPRGIGNAAAAAAAAGGFARVSGGSQAFAAAPAAAFPPSAAGYSYASGPIQALPAAAGLQGPQVPGSNLSAGTFSTAGNTATARLWGTQVAQQAQPHSQQQQQDPLLSSFMYE